MHEPAPISNYVNGSAIHLSLQGKGGVGKSFIASILAQYFLNHGHQVQCIDTLTYAQRTEEGTGRESGKGRSRSRSVLSSKMKGSRTSATSSTEL